MRTTRTYPSPNSLDGMPKSSRSPLVDVIARHPTRAFIALLAIFLLVRIVTLSGEVLLGEDSGNYVSTMNYVLHNDIAETGDRRPPLIGFLLAPVSYAVGPLQAIKVWALLSSVLLAVPAFFLFKKVCRPWLALFCSVALINFMYYSNVLFWGFLPLLGLVVGVFVWYALVRLLEEPSVTRALWLALLLVGVANVNQAASSFVIYTVIAVVILSWAIIPYSRKSFLYVILAGLGAAILSLSTLPYNYAHIELGYLQDADFSLNLNLLSVTLTALLLPLCFYISHRVGGATGVLVGVVLVSTLLFTKVDTSSIPLHALFGRMHYYYPIASFLVIGWALERLALLPRMKTFFTSAKRRYYAGVLGLTVIVLLTIMYTVQFTTYAGIFRTVREEHVQAVEWVKENTSPNETFVVFPYTVGWLVEGVANRAVYYPHRIQQQYLEERGILGTSWYEQPGNVTALKALGWYYPMDTEGVDYIVADRGVVKNHPEWPPSSTWETLEPFLVWEEGTVAIYDVRGGS